MLWLQAKCARNGLETEIDNGTRSVDNLAPNPGDPDGAAHSEGEARKPETYLEVGNGSIGQ